MITKSRSARRICLVPELSGVGGMVSFQHKLSAGLQRRGFEVCYNLKEFPAQAVLVIGGTRNLAGLWHARRLGIPVVQRLDGMNWLHKRLGLRKVGWRHYLRAEYGNQLLALIRRRFAEKIVYQSEFSRSWWEQVYGKRDVEQRVIYNGVDLDLFHPFGEGFPPVDLWRVLLVEGSLMGGYEHGLSVAVEFIKALAGLIRQGAAGQETKSLELAIAGRTTEPLKVQWEGIFKQVSPEFKIQLHWYGLLPHEQIPGIDRSAHLLFSADINPACPNSVIEAMACGLPIASFATGAIPELVKQDAGAVVPYGGDPWALDPPDVISLARAALVVLTNLEHYRRRAREQAEAEFGLERMVDSYAEMLFMD